MGSGTIQYNVETPINATPTTASPITAPPKKATSKPFLVPIVHPWAALVFALTPTYIPSQPANIEPTAPII